jgi:DNA-binding MarR family transcriptional regulator
MPLERVIHVAEFRASLRAFMRESERIARRWELTPQRYLLLLTIKGAPDGSERLRFTDLAERLQLSPNATTELVARAEAEDDQRVTYLRLTREGERRLSGALLESDRFRRDLIHGFEELAKKFRRASRQ